MRALLILFMTARARERRLRVRAQPRVAPSVGIYAGSVYLCVAAGRLDRRPAARPAARDALRRRPHRLRALLDRHCLVRAEQTPFFVGPRPDRARHGPAQAEHLARSSATCTRRTARGATRASRSSTWASTSARSSASSSPDCLGETVGWHWGFGAAGVGMLIGLAWYRFAAGRTLGNIGMEPHPRS